MKVPQSSGIYRIKSKCKPERTYIGSAVNLRKRKRAHFNELKDNHHPNRKIQNHYNKYGKSDLTFEVVEFCLPYFLTAREQYYMDKGKSWFNLCKIAGSSYGVKRLPETGEKISKANKGKKLSEENKRKLIASWKGSKHSDEARKKMSEAKKGRKFTEEHKRKMSEAHKGMKGKSHSEETRRKISETKKNQKRIECPHCGSTTAMTHYKRYHGDNCKHKHKLQTA